MVKCSLFKRSVNRYYLLSLAVALLLTLVYRFLLPFGDEPDFTVRSFGVLFGEHPLWSPYSLLSSIYQGLNIDSVCEIDSSLFSLLSNIDSVSCSENYEQVFTRWFLTLLVLSPLLFLPLLIKDRFVSMDRQVALGFTLICPSFIYYSGVLAVEQFTLVLSMFTFLFINKKAILIILLALIGLLDFGNFLVVLVFLLSLYAYTHLNNVFGSKTVNAIIAIQLLFTYVFGLFFIEVLSNISFFADKTNAILSAVEGSDVLSKYPLILRPIITFLTGVFYTPSTVKAYLLYAFFIYGIVSSFFSVKRYFNNLKSKGSIVEIEEACSRRLTLYVALSTILTCVFILPGYGNAKYYIFLMPYIIHCILLSIPKVNVFLFFMVANILLIIHLIIYRL